MRRLDGKPANVKYQNLTGKRFGLLTALRSLPKEIGKPRRWACLCDCGVEKSAPAGDLIGGNNRSCGCRKKQAAGDRNRLPNGVASFNVLYFKYTESAEKRNLEFSISKEEFSTLTNSLCTYCGTPPTKTFSNKGSTAYTYNGVDRVNNEVGYIKENCVPCCYTCNIAKGSMSLVEFLAWIDRLIKFQNLKVMPSASE